MRAEIVVGGAHPTDGGGRVSGFGGLVQADNVTWIDPGDGLWREVYRWSSNPNLPAAGDDVTIDVPNANVLVLINQDVQTIHSLTSNEKLTIESGGLSVAADSVVHGAFTLSGGFLSGAGNFTLNGPSTWINQTTMDGTGTTIVSATGSLSIVPGTFSKNLARPLDNFGSVTLVGDSVFASIALMGSTINNRTGATFTVDNGANAFFFGASGTNAFLNNGTFVKSGTAIATFGGTGSNPVPFVNSGQVNVQAGTLILQTGANHTGDFAISAGATLQFEAGHTFAAGSDITGAGNVIFNSVGTNISGGVFNVSGSTTFAGGANTFNGAFTAANFFVPNGATFTFNGATTFGNLTATNLLLDGSGDVSISGTSQWTGFGAMAGSGKTIITPGATLELIANGAPKNIQRTLVNKGTVNWGGSGPLATLNLTDALFDNQIGATFNATGDQYSFFGASGTNAFNNAGLFSKSGTGSASFTGSAGSIVAFSNSGTVAVSAGLLQLDAPFPNSGVVTLSGGTITLSAGLMNTGTINVTGGVLNLAGTITTAQLGTWSNNGGQVNLLGTLNNASSTLALDDTTGQLQMAAGSKIVGGAISTAGSSRLKIVGAATLDGVSLSGAVNIFQSANLAVLNGLTLSGPLTLDASGTSLVTFQGSHSIGGTGEVTTAGGPGTATLAVSAGDTLTIASGITVHPGTRDITLGAAGASVVNQGTLLTDAAGTTLNVAGNSVQNLGTVQAKNGGTIFINAPLANVSGGTLSGGSWRIASGGTLRLQSANITTNAAELVLDGADSDVLTGASGTNSALANLVQNAAAGDLSILNGHNLSTTGDFLNNGKLTIGAGSTLTIAGLFTDNGTMTTSGTISSGKSTIDGFLTLAGGTHTTSSDFVVGSTKNDARYDLTGGALSVAGFGTIGMGPAGAGVFNQSGGTFSVSKQLFVASAGSNTSTFNLSGGALNAGELLVGFFGGAQGIFNQTGGAVTLTPNPAVGASGGLTLAFSSLGTTSGTYNLSSGALTDQTVQIGFAGPGHFNQSGGTHTVNGGLSIGMFSGGTGTYSMSNGATLNVTLDETVGMFGNGVFNQTGGVNNISGLLKIGPNSGAFGTFNLSGGTVNVAIVDLVRGKFNMTGGRLNAMNFLHEGGDVAGTFENLSVYTYQGGGTFSGRLINSGTVVMYVDFTAENGLDNRNAFDVAANRKVTLNGAGFSGNGTTTLSGTLTASVERIGETANGAFTQNSGANNVTGDLTIGYGAGFTGAYTLTSGSLNVGGNETIGLDGGGTINQTGGTHTVTGTTTLGKNGGSRGIYNLSGGTFTAGAINLMRGAINLTGGTLNYTSLVQNGGDISGTLSNATSYTFNAGTFSGRLINSGTVVLNADLTLGDGLDNRAGFSVAANRIVALNGIGLVNDGAFELAGKLNAAKMKIGVNGDGAFTQTSGTNAVAENLYVGHGAGHAGSYLLQSGALNVAGNSYIGFDGAGTFNHDDGTHTTTNLIIAGNVGSSGAYTLASGNLAAASTTNNGTYTQTGGAASLGNVSGAGAMSVSGGSVAAKSIRQNSLNVANNAIVSLAVNSGVSVVKTLTLPGSGSATAAVDVGNNSLVIDYTGDSPIAQVRASILSGYGAGPTHWGGPGIRSSAATTDLSLGLAVAEASDLLHISADQTATFQGETVDATSVLVRVTKTGDTNLDGKVTFGDFQRFELGFGQPNATWQTGDFNYDGVVNAVDFALLYANYGTALGAAPLPVSAAELQTIRAFAGSVPEPSGGVIMLMAGAGAMLRRKRRSIG